MPLDKIQSFKIDPQDAEKLERMATARGTSVGAVIRDAIHDAIYSPAWAMERLEEIKKRVEAEYASRFAILETAKNQVEERIRALSADLKDLTERKAALIKLESETDDPKKALTIRKECSETQDLLNITNERLEQARQKLGEIAQGLKMLEREKNATLNDALRQDFPTVCEPLLEGITNRLVNVANALRPYLAAFASPATPENLLAKFLWNKLGEMARGKDELAYALIGKPSPFARSHYEDWQSFWKFWSWQTGCKLPIEAEVAGDQETASEEPREEAGLQAESANEIKIEI
jgi:predicted transcriptional regulator